MNIPMTPIVRERLRIADDTLQRLKLRGHVYIVGDAVFWFATKKEELQPDGRLSEPEIVGRTIVLDALTLQRRHGNREIDALRAEATAFLESLPAEAAPPTEDIPARTLWSTPSLVVTGAPAALVLAMMLDDAGAFSHEAIGRILERQAFIKTGARASVEDVIEQCDLNHRRITKRILSQLARIRIAEIHSGSTAITIDEPHFGKWLHRASELHEDGSSAAAQKAADTLFRTPAIIRHPESKYLSIGQFEYEANLEPFAPDAFPTRRLWLRYGHLSTAAAAEKKELPAAIVVLNAVDTAKHKVLRDPELATWLMQAAREHIEPVWID